MMDEKWLLTMLGFAAKARKAVAGESNVEAALKKDKVELLIIAVDASAKNKEHWQREKKKKNIPLLSAAAQTEIGLAMGLSPRAIIAVMDRQMKEAILARK